MQLALLSSTSVFVMRSAPRYLSTRAPEQTDMEHIWPLLLMRSQGQVNPQLEAEPASQIQLRSANFQTHREYKQWVWNNLLCRIMWLQFTDTDTDNSWNTPTHQCHYTLPTLTKTQFTDNPCSRQNWSRSYLLQCPNCHEALLDTWTSFILRAHSKIIILEARGSAALC